MQALSKFAFDTSTLFIRNSFSENNEKLLPLFKQIIIIAYITGSTQILQAAEFANNSTYLYQSFQYKKSTQLLKLLGYSLDSNVRSLPVKNGDEKRK